MNAEKKERKTKNNRIILLSLLRESCYDLSSFLNAQSQLGAHFTPALCRNELHAWQKNNTLTTSIKSQRPATADHPTRHHRQPVSKTQPPTQQSHKNNDASPTTTKARPSSLNKRNSKQILQNFQTLSNNSLLAQRQKQHATSQSTTSASASKTDLPNIIHEKLASKIRDCTRCDLQCAPDLRSLAIPNFHRNDSKATRPTAMFVGSRINEEHLRQQSIFTGAEGEMMDKIISAMNLQKNEIYFTNALKCCVDATTKINNSMLFACAPFLKQQITMLRPRVVVLWGQSAYYALTGDSATILQKRGSWFELDGIKIMPTLNPRHLLKNPKHKALVWQDLKQVIKHLKLDEAKTSHKNAGR